MQNLFNLRKSRGGGGRLTKTTFLAISLIALMFGVKAQNITGSGTAGYLPQFTDISTIGNSRLYQNEPYVGINTTTPQGALDIYNVCGAGNVATLVVNTNTTSSALFGCLLSGGQIGDAIVVRNTVGALFGGTTTRTDFIVRSGSGMVGIGKAEPAAQLDIQPTSSNIDPLLINNSSSAVIFNIKTTGKIGVGTAAPDALLHIKNTNSNTHPMAMYNSDNDAIFSISNLGSVGVGVSAANHSAYMDVKPTSFDYYGWLYRGQDETGNTRFAVSTDGRASIGSTPAFNVSTLTLKSALGSNTATSLDMVAPGSTGWANQIRFLASNNNIRHLIVDDYGTNNLLIKPGNGGGANNVLKIEGKVRIGNTAPTGTWASYQLGVDGDIVAKRVVVQTSSWADHVFADDYKLLSLEEVEAFVKQHKHLPEIPSEREVQESGVSLGEMNGLLLQKVEELTLHLIEVKKELDNLKK